MKSLLLILTAVPALLAGGNLRAALLLSDDFTGTAGTGVNGRTVQYYDTSYYSSAPKWNASPRVLISGSNSAVIDEATKSGGGVAPLATSLFTGSVTIEGTIVTGGSSYVALSLLANGSTDVFDPKNPFLLALWNTGNVTLYKNGGTSALSAGITGFSTSTAYSLSLQYSFETSLASIYVNNVLLTSAVITGLNSSSITGAGFYLLSAQPATTTLDNFKLSAVPEPATGPLTGLALASAFVFYYKRAKARNKGANSISLS